MKIAMRRIFFLFVCVTTFWRSGTGQSITGDTIFVNAEAEIGIKFPTRPSGFYTIPKDAPYNFVTIPLGFTIGAKSENIKPAQLFVTEGENSHQFVLVFKKDIDYNNTAELSFDYSTKKKLAQRVKEIATKKAKEPFAQTSPATPNVPADAVNKTNPNIPPANVPNNNPGNYYALMEEGDKDLKLGRYNEAKVNFDKALALRPGDAIALQRLEEIKFKIAGKESFADTEKNRKYTQLTGEAIALFDLKKYAGSKEAYNKVLELRPGDLYSINQLKKIDKILNNEKGVEEQKRMKELYTGYMNEGEKELNRNQLTNARIAFEQALVIKQNDAVATARIKSINEKEKQQKEKQDIENSYQEAIGSADKLYMLHDYANAKAAYNKALGFIKKPFPLDQISIINKMMAEQAALETAEKQKRLKQDETDKKESERIELENSYYAIVQKADKLYGNGDYANAKVEYTNAIRIINRPWPNEQIEKIKFAIQEQSKVALNEMQRLAKQAEIEKRERENQELENKYTAVIQSADKLFKAGDLNNARVEYVRAAGVIKRPWPEEQIGNITRILEEQAAAESAEKQRVARETKVSAQYNAIIQKADMEFSNSNYIKARQLYSDAALLKPAEPHPEERLQIIATTLEFKAKAVKERNDSIAAVAELKKMYDIAVSRGRSYYLKEDFANAKIAYEEAVALKPAEAETRNQLEKINKKLDDLEKERELNARYDSKITGSDSLLIAKEYELALIAFTEAAALKPDETYPVKQIKYIQQERIIKAFKDSIIREKERMDRYNKASRSAELAKTEKRYGDAINSYNEALAINPSNESLQKGLKIALYQHGLQVEKAKADETALAAKAQKPAESKKKGRKKEIQKNTESDNPNLATVDNEKGAVPYTAEELKSKYPAIDFTTLPPQQPLNKDAVNSLQLQQAFKQVLTENPRLDISATDQAVKIICQGIFFKDKNSCFRFLVQNNSENDFLTGAMMLSWTRLLGNKVKLYPSDIFPSFLPVIKPGSEAVVVYVCKSYVVDNKEKMEFELTDRLEKINLKLNFSGKVYNDELSK